MRVAIFLLISILVVHTQAIDACSAAKNVGNEVAELIGYCIKKNLALFSTGLDKDVDSLTAKGKEAIQAAIGIVCGRRRRA